MSNHRLVEQRVRSQRLETIEVVVKSYGIKSGRLTGNHSPQGNPEHQVGRKGLSKWRYTIWKVTNGMVFGFVGVQSGRVPGDCWHGSVKLMKCFPLCSTTTGLKERCPHPLGLSGDGRHPICDYWPVANRCLRCFADQLEDPTTRLTEFHRYQSSPKCKNRHRWPAAINYN